METSYIVHRDPGGDRLVAVLSLSILRSMDAAKIAALQQIGIRTVSDLLHYVPIHRARLIAAVARGQVAHDLDLRTLLRDGALPVDPATLVAAPTSIIDGIGAATAALFAEHFGVTDVGGLAELAPFAEAEALLRHEAEPFTEPASAPDELIPRATGSVASTIRLSSIIHDRTLSLPGVSIETWSTGDPQLARVLAQHDPAELAVGYVALHTQRWVDMGTGLGEVVQSIGLAPGESRNIAIVDWRRRHLFRRDENGATTEELANATLHGRALDDVAQAVAQEHQWGRTIAAAATGVAGAGIVVGLGAAAGAALGAGVGGLGGEVIGAVAGAVIGAEVAGPIGAAAGGATGLAVGGVVGSVAGLVGGAVIGGVAGGVGYIQSDTRGDRRILAEDRQNIMDTTGQKASFARSVRSTIVIEDAQAERVVGRTQNITNYNHSHALNLTYYELLDRYLVQLRTERVEPFVVLPIAPLEITRELVAAYWDLIGPAIPDRRLADQFGRWVAADGTLQLPPPPVDGGDQLIRVELEIERQPAGDVPDKVWIMKADGNKMELQISALPSLGSGINAVDGARSDAAFNAALRDVRGVRFQINGAHFGSHYAVRVASADIRIAATGEVIRIDRKDLGSQNVSPAPSGSIELDYPWNPLADLGAAQAEQASAHDAIARVVAFIRRRRYLFTRVILTRLEPEQLVDLIRGLRFKVGGQLVPVTDYLDPMPIGYSARGVLFRARPVVGGPAALDALGNYPLDIEAWFAKAGDGLTTRDLYLPAQGVFCEAILGRSNGSEKVDLTRFWNWQDSPIPNAAPAIAAVDTGSRAEPLPSATPTIPANVINISTPTALPDASGMTGILGAIQNPNLFRDMSKAELLTGMLANLAGAAERAATTAGTLAGQAAHDAVTQAVDLGKSVAALASKLAEVTPKSGSGGAGTGAASAAPDTSDETFTVPEMIGVAPPSNPTTVGGYMNAAEKARPAVTRKPAATPVQVVLASRIVEPARGLKAGLAGGLIELGFAMARDGNANPVPQMVPFEPTTGMSINKVTLTEGATYTLLPKVTLSMTSASLLGGYQLDINGLDPLQLASAVAGFFQPDINVMTTGTSITIARGMKVLDLDFELELRRDEANAVTFEVGTDVGLTMNASGKLELSPGRLGDLAAALATRISAAAGVVAGALLSAVSLTATRTATTSGELTATTGLKFTIRPAALVRAELKVRT